MICSLKFLLSFSAMKSPMVINCTDREAKWPFLLHARVSQHWARSAARLILAWCFCLSLIQAKQHLSGLFTLLAASSLASCWSLGLNSCYMHTSQSPASLCEDVCYMSGQFMNSWWLNTCTDTSFSPSALVHKQMCMNKRSVWNAGFLLLFMWMISPEEFQYICICMTKRLIFQMRHQWRTRKLLFKQHCSWMMSHTV